MARAPDDRGRADGDLLERVWRVLSRWAVPVMMSLAYVLLAVTSETDATGEAWMAVGLLLVMTVWFVFRALTASAALSRALAVGDTARLTALASELPRTRRPASRSRLLIARGLAELLRGRFAEAAAAIDEAQPALPVELAPLAAVVRIAARIEQQPPVLPEEPGAPVGSPRAPALGWLAEGMIAWRAGDREAAAAQLQRVIDDIRAGSAVRSIAHVYAARLADARGDRAAAARHRAAASTHAAPDASWLRGSSDGSHASRAATPA